MKQIKFRAWDKEKKEMFSPRRLEQTPGGGIWVKDKNLLLGDGKGCEIAYTDWKNADVELMQFTGLKDKNNKEIYEGDIIKPYSEKGMNNKVVGVVIFEKAGFIIKLNERERVSLLVNNQETFEIIGNIHENPELLK